MRLSPKEIDKLGLAGDLVLYRFDTIETLSPGKGKRTKVLVRGGAIKSAEMLNQKGVSDIAKKLANQIVKWQSKQGSVQSTFDVTKGVFTHVSLDSKITASDDDQALAYYALTLQRKQVAGEIEFENYKMHLKN